MELTADASTTVCISVSARPSNFGMTVHNAAYRALGLNFLYKAFGTNDIGGVIAAVRALGIRGCSVSMPFKQAVIPFLDELDEAAAQIGAVNTVVNDDGKLTGLNTDASGAFRALKELGAEPGQRAVVLGAGGAARAVLYALARHGISDIAVAARDATKAAALSEVVPCRVIGFDRLLTEQVDLLINATPVGMPPELDATPVDMAALPTVKWVMDLVVSASPSGLIRQARALGKAASPGWRMSLYQAASQFELYTGHEPPLEVMERAVKDFLARPA